MGNIGRGDLLQLSKLQPYIKKILNITHIRTAYLPEFHAYAKFLTRKNLSVPVSGIYVCTVLFLIEYLNRGPFRLIGRQINNNVGVL